MEGESLFGINCQNICNFDGIMFLYNCRGYSTKDFCLYLHDLSSHSVLGYGWSYFLYMSIQNRVLKSVRTTGCHQL